MTTWIKLEQLNAAIELALSNDYSSHATPYRAGPRAPNFESDKIDRMLAPAALEPTKIEREALILLAPKNDQPLRFDMEYCMLHAVTTEGSYPIPHKDECIVFLGEAMIFSTQEGNSHHCRVEVPDENRAKLTFASYHRLFCLIRLPFGLKRIGDHSAREGLCKLLV